MVTTTSRVETPASPGPESGLMQDPERRRRLIAEAAYFRAERRGFTGGDPLDDWLQAEAEIDRMAPRPNHQQQNELAAYRKLRDKVEEQLRAMHKSVNAQTLKDALDTATDELKELRHYTAATVNRVANALKKDMASTARTLGPKWERYSERATGVYEVWRGRSREFLEHANAAVGDWVKKTRAKWKHPVYQAGEMTEGGTFICRQCGAKHTLPEPSHLQPCASCGATEFDRE